MSYSGAMRKR